MQNLQDVSRPCMRKKQLYASAAATTVGTFEENGGRCNIRVRWLLAPSLYNVPHLNASTDADEEEEKPILERSVSEELVVPRL